MIPCLRSTLAKHPTTTDFVQLLAKAGFSGEIETSAAGRTIYSTDNSIYQVPPRAILFPRCVEDLKIVTSVVFDSGENGLVIAPRGGGTGTNGQSLTSGIVVDCSRHMNSIIEIDPVRRVAHVQAGVVKDQLNRALEPYGLFFAPELSTSNRATIGGMVSTDACGQGSCLYGKTSNHVLALRVILMDGSDWWSRPLDDITLHAICERTDRIGEIHRTIDRIEREKRNRIAEVFPNLNRYMTGYDLAHIRRPDGRFDLNAILCGSEGTLALVAEVELNLLPIPSHAALINIRYDDFNTALEDARALTELKVASVETVDEKVLELAKGDIVWNDIAEFFPHDPARPANAINIVEIVAEDEGELEHKLAEVTVTLEGGRTRQLGYMVTRNHADIQAIWLMRKRAVGLLGNVEGPVRPIAFVEDTAVPPENLAAYIREFRATLDRFDVSYGMFGHVDAGVLHVRPALDLTRNDHVPLVREISNAVVALTRKYGGVLWGEHGKGVRSEYVPEFFGDLYPSLQEIKQAFDPENRLNPGKIAAPQNERLLKIDDVPFRGETDRAIGNDIRAAFDNAPYCNGNGACFDFEEKSPMCPSYKATGDRRFSPKGRAALMREWLRLLVEAGIDPRKEATELRRRHPLSGIVRRLFNSLNPANRGDFSHEVRAAMDTCLSCKACAGHCPVKVNVPAFRSKFLELYYGRYLRPLKHPLVGCIESSLPFMSCIRPLYNLAVSTTTGKALTRSVGLTALPRLASESLAEQANQLGVAIATPDLLAGMTAEDRQHTVVFIVDIFTAHFDPTTAVAAIKIARAMDLLPLLAPAHVNGKALHVHGYLRRFEKAADKSARALRKLADFGVVLVGVDPSMTLAYRSDYAGRLGSAAKPAVLLPQEWLSASLHKLKPSVFDTQRRFRLFSHCTERTNVPTSLADWRAVFNRLGTQLETADLGCCGMAGTFGHETSNRRLSEKLYSISWQQEINRAGPLDVLMATGYSCRSQIKEIDGRKVPHPLEIIGEIMTRSRFSQGTIRHDM